MSNILFTCLYSQCNLHKLDWFLKCQCVIYMLVSKTNRKSMKSLKIWHRSLISLGISRPVKYLGLPLLSRKAPRMVSLFEKKNGKCMPPILGGVLEQEFWVTLGFLLKSFFIELMILKIIFKSSVIQHRTWTKLLKSLVILCYLIKSL